MEPIQPSSGALPEILAALLEQNKRAALRRGSIRTKASDKGVKRRRAPPPPSVKTKPRIAPSQSSDDTATTGDVGDLIISCDSSGIFGGAAGTGERTVELLTGDLTSQQKQHLYSCLSVYTNRLPEKDLTPHQWFFVEAIEYWNAVMLPNRAEDEFAVYERPSRSYGYYPTFRAAPMAVTAALAYHISAVYRERDQPIEWEATGEMAAIWTKFNSHLAFLVRYINDKITLSSTEKVPLLLDYIMKLTFITPDTWRPHVDAFYRLLYLRGGVKKVIEAGEVSRQAVSLMMVRAVFSETTSPSTEPVRCLDLFSIEDIREQYVYHFLADPCCPTDLFIQIRKISQLRSRVSQGAPSDEVSESARSILSAITEFSPSNWKRSEPSHWNFSDDDALFECIAHMYKDAVLVYGVVSLPDYAAAILLNGVAKSVQRQRLMEKISTAWRRIISNHPALFWSLVVAGVAYADGDQVSQKIISDRLYQIGRRPDCSSAPLSILRKLEAFWMSGSTAWDDCFDECLVGTAV